MHISQSPQPVKADTRRTTSTTARLTPDQILQTTQVYVVADMFVPHGAMKTVEERRVVENGEGTWRVPRACWQVSLP